MSEPQRPYQPEEEALVSRYGLVDINEWQAENERLRSQQLTELRAMLEDNAEAEAARYAERQGAADERAEERRREGENRYLNVAALNSAAAFCRGGAVADVFEVAAAFREWLDRADTTPRGSGVSS